MIFISSILLIVTFLSISGLHFYWSLGGKYLIDLAIPTQTSSSQKPLFQPGLLATLIVASSFIGFAWAIGAKTGLFPTFQIPLPYINNTVMGIAVIFMLRAIGEFRYVGLFKKIKKTAFADMDTFYYSPLCFFVSLLTFYIYL